MISDDDFSKGHFEWGHTIVAQMPHFVPSWNWFRAGVVLPSDELQQSSLEGTNAPTTGQISASQDVAESSSYSQVEVAIFGHRGSRERFGVEGTVAHNVPVGVV